MRAPISVVIPTLNSEDQLTDTLLPLMEGLPKGLIREVIVTDGGSKDSTQRIADDCGAVFLENDPSPGRQLRKGADVAVGKWLLFLYPGTVLSDGWTDIVEDHMASRQAGYGRLRFKDGGLRGTLVALWANLRSRWFGLPYGDQALLVPTSLYNQVGGHEEIPVMEDVQIARALKGRLQPLTYDAVVRSAQYRQGGWMRRGRRNLWALLRYLTGAQPDRLAAKLQR